MKTTLSMLWLLLCIELSAQLSFNQFHGAKSLATGNIYTVQNGIQSLYGNPAQLLSVEQWAANLNVQNQYEIPEITAFQLSTAHHSKKLGALGICLFQMGTGSFRDQQFGLVYAKTISGKVSLGIKLNWLHTTMEGYSSIDKITVEIGSVYRLSDRIEMALHIFNPALQNYAAGRALPVCMSLGLKYVLNDQLILMSEIEKDIYHPSRIKVGIKYKLMHNFTIALGMYSSEKSANLTAGIGYYLSDKLDLDLSFCYHQWLGLSSSLGMDYYIGGK